MESCAREVHYPAIVMHVISRPRALFDVQEFGKLFRCALFIANVVATVIIALDIVYAFSEQTSAGIS